METIDTELIVLLKFLLPGFVAAWVFYALSSYPKQSQFERIVQALIFTILVEGISYIFKCLLLKIGESFSLGAWQYNSDFILSLLCAIGFGLVISFFSNNDKFHAVLRKLNITRETSYASEWFGTFSSNITYVVLHLTDGRRIYGWPIEWPTEPEKGHFVLAQACWLDANNSEIALDGVESILIRGSDVYMVEFMKSLEELAHDKESIESTPASSKAT